MSYALDDRPWFEKWWLVTEGLADLQRLYRGETILPNLDHYRALTARFCSDCWDMKDWLFHDSGRVPAPARAGAEGCRTSDPAIKLTGDVANTYKHRRRRPGQRPAGVIRVDVSGQQATIVIAWWDPTTGTIGGTRDALDLAIAAVDQWRAFFATHALVSPY